MTHRPATIASQQELYEQAAGVIERRFGERDFGLTDLARELALSRRQLQRVLRESAGVTFSEVLERTRMEHARRLLAEEELSSVRVAAAVGYSQPSGFAKAFRRYWDCAPHEARMGAGAERNAD